MSRREQLDLGDVTARNVTVSGTITGSGYTTSSTALGFATGAGGTVTQGTSKTTGVTINKKCGTITTHNASIAASSLTNTNTTPAFAGATFTVTNSTVSANDVIILSLKSGAADPKAYHIYVSAVGAGSFAITIVNISDAAVAEALVINFAVIDAVAA